MGAMQVEEKNKVAMGKMPSGCLKNWQNLFHYRIKSIKVLIHLKDITKNPP